MLHFLRNLLYICILTGTFSIDSLVLSSCSFIHSSITFLSSLSFCSSLPVLDSHGAWRLEKNEKSDIIVVFFFNDLFSLLVFNFHSYFCQICTFLKNQDQKSNRFDSISNKGYEQNIGCYRPMILTHSPDLKIPTGFRKSSN